MAEDMARTKRTNSGTTDNPTRPKNVERGYMSVWRAAMVDPETKPEERSRLVDYVIKDGATIIRRMANQQDRVAFYATAADPAVAMKVKQHGDAATVKAYQDWLLENASFANYQDINTVKQMAENEQIRIDFNPEGTKLIATRTKAPPVPEGSAGVLGGVTSHVAGAFQNLIQAGDVQGGIDAVDRINKTFNAMLTTQNILNGGAKPLPLIDALKQLGVNDALANRQTPVTDLMASLSNMTNRQVIRNVASLAAAGQRAVKVGEDFALGGEDVSDMYRRLTGMSDAEIHEVVKYSPDSVPNDVKTELGYSFDPASGWNREAPVSEDTSSGTTPPQQGRTTTIDRSNRFAEPALDAGDPSFPNQIEPGSAQPTAQTTQQRGVDLVDQGFINVSESGRADAPPETQGYVPVDSSGKAIGQSGVTVAGGVDLGQHSLSYFEGLGLPPTLVSKIKPYIGLKKEKAVEVASQLALTEEEAVQLRDVVRSDFVETVAANFEKDSGQSFTTVAPEWRTAIVDLAFQYGKNLKKAAPKFWAQVTKGKAEDALANLRDFKDKFPSRRNREADLVEGVPLFGAGRSPNEDPFKGDPIAGLLNSLSSPTAG
jgi:hypothetical protein